MRTTINQHRKPAWIGFLLGLLTACILIGQAYAFLWTEQQKANSRNHLFWDSYLNAMYGVDKNWSSVIKQFKQDSDPQRLAADAGLRLYNADQKLLFDAAATSSSDKEDVTAAGIDLRTVKDGNRTLGYYSLPAAPFHHPEPPFWAAVLAGSLLVGGAAGLYLKRGDKRFQTMLDRILFRLSVLAREDGSGLSFRRGKINDGTDINARTAEADALLTGVEDKLRQMETVRPRMVADLTQELRRPLTVLRSSLEQAQIEEKRLTTDKAAALFEEVSLMSALVNDMQQLMLAESGHLELERQWFSLRASLDPLIARLETEARASGIELRYSPSREVSLYGDRHKLEQAFGHLIGNAVRLARSSAAVSVTVNDLEVTVTVRDDGAGLAHDEIPHLFERFYRTAYPSAAAASEPGLGFGMALVKQYVEAHNGSVRVTSEAGQGTSFTVRLPIFTGT
ncbi:sensor histidine kinase [Paenibacillus sp. 1P03SA]|uniref:sensor histidine kinase n=1 Tax=Paenibacillus sp. 1P03SA TaxID=3132294 RepID=UPI00399F98D8